MPPFPPCEISHNKTKKPKMKNKIKIEQLRNFKISK